MTSLGWVSLEDSAKPSASAVNSDKIDRRAGSAHGACARSASGVLPVGEHSLPIVVDPNAPRRTWDIMPKILSIFSDERLS